MASRQQTGRPAGLPLTLIEQAIPRLSRHDLEALTERLIDRLDMLDPDPDQEDDTEDRCSAYDDAGSMGPTPTGWDEEDELPHQPLSLN